MLVGFKIETSSALKVIGYDDDSETIWVGWDENNVYAYTNRSVAEFDGIMNSSSRGQAVGGLKSSNTQSTPQGAPTWSASDVFIELQDESAWKGSWASTIAEVKRTAARNRKPLSERMPMMSIVRSFPGACAFI